VVQSSEVRERIATVHWRYSLQVVRSHTCSMSSYCSLSSESPRQTFYAHSNACMLITRLIKF